MGELELNRNPENYFAEVEQAAFKPSAVVPGIGPSPDRMLQARLMSYADTHLHRLGVNHQQIDPQQAALPGAQLHPRRPGRDRGQLRRPAQLLAQQPRGHAGAGSSVRRSGMAARQTIVDRFDSTQDHDDYTQPGNFYRLFDEGHRDRLAIRIAGVLGQARTEVQLRQVGYFFRADEDYGRRVAETLGLKVEEAMGEGVSTT